MFFLQGFGGQRMGETVEDRPKGSFLGSVTLSAVLLAHIAFNRRRSWISWVQSRSAAPGSSFWVWAPKLAAALVCL